ncbi:MAG: DUF3341 domain-containing protein [bacterium]
MANDKKKPLGILAEFKNPAELVKAAEAVRDEGYEKFDCHSPFPIHGMDSAMGLKRSPLGFIVFIMGTIGLLSGIALTWYAAVEAYPLVISGKPFFSCQAFVPVYFEMTVLLAAFGAVFGMFHLNRLPQLFHNFFYSERFAKVTNDGFFVSLEANDPKFDSKKSQAFFESIGASHIELIEGK